MALRRTRFELLRERVLAMKALWTDEEAQFHGEFVNFDPVWLYPAEAEAASADHLRGETNIPSNAWWSSATVGSHVHAATGSQGVQSLV